MNHEPHVDSCYLATARRQMPGASEEIVQEHALRLQKKCKENAREFAARRYPNKRYRSLSEEGGA